MVTSLFFADVSILLMTSSKIRQKTEIVIVSERKVVEKWFTTQCFCCGKLSSKKHIWPHDTDVTSRDVIWRDFQILRKKKCWRQQKWYLSGHLNIFFWREFTKTKKMRGEPFLHDFLFRHSDDFRFWRIFDDVSKKMLTSAKNNDVTMLQVIKKLNLDVVLHFCQVVCKMAKNWLF